MPIRRSGDLQCLSNVKLLVVVELIWMSVRLVMMPVHKMWKSRILLITLRLLPIKKLML